MAVTKTTKRRRKRTSSACTIVQQIETRYDTELTPRERSIVEVTIGVMERKDPYAET